jgi:hypothetical protein
MYWTLLKLLALIVNACPSGSTVPAKVKCPLAREDHMATYDPPQPLWKRNVVGVLDFLLAFFVFGLLFNRIFGYQPHPPVINSAVTTTEVFGLDGWSALLTILLVIVYFIVLGRTGGTIFQRLFGMRRVA